MSAPRQQQAIVTVFLSALVSASLAALSAAPASAAVSIVSTSPAAGAVVHIDPLEVSVDVTSLWTISTAKAAIGSSEVTLSCSAAGAGFRCSGRLPIGTLASGDQALAIAVTNSSNEMTTANVPVVIDRAPVIEIEEPFDEAVARPRLRIRAKCRDDLPPGCVTLTVAAGRTLASGTSEIDTEVDLTPDLGTTVTLKFSATDNAGHVTSTSRTVWADVDPKYQNPRSFAGVLLDYDASRIVSVQSTTLHVYTAGVAAPFTWEPTPGVEIMVRSARLTPKGAIWTDRSNGWELRNGTVISHPNLRHYDVRGSTLLLQDNAGVRTVDLEQGGRIVTEFPAYRNSTDDCTSFGSTCTIQGGRLIGDGSVVFRIDRSLYTYFARWKNGVHGPLLGPGILSHRVRRYEADEHSIVVANDGPIGLSVLTQLFSDRTNVLCQSSLSVCLAFAYRNGYVLFQVQSQTGEGTAAMLVYPDGRSASIAAFEKGYVGAEDVSSDGRAMTATQDKRYYAKPNEFAQALARKWGKVRWVDPDFFISLSGATGGTILRFVPDATVLPPDGTGGSGGSGGTGGMGGGGTGPIMPDGGAADAPLGMGGAAGTGSDDADVGGGTPAGDLDAGLPGTPPRSDNSGDGCSYGAGTRGASGWCLSLFVFMLSLALARRRVR